MNTEPKPPMPPEVAKAWALVEAILQRWAGGATRERAARQQDQTATDAG